MIHHPKKFSKRAEARIFGCLEEGFSKQEASIVHCTSILAGSQRKMLPQWLVCQGFQCLNHHHLAVRNVALARNKTSTIQTEVLHNPDHLFVSTQISDITGMNIFTYSTTSLYISSNRFVCQSASNQSETMNVFLVYVYGLYKFILAHL